jgi:lambda family phage portal protein
MATATPATKSRAAYMRSYRANKKQERTAGVTRVTGVTRGSVRNSSTYDAASTGRRTLNWEAPSVSPNASVLQSLSTLRSRSRMAVRNNGYAKGTLDKLVTNIVGTGMRPRSQAEDLGIRRTIQQLWAKWIKRSDADGLLAFYGQQRQAVACWLEAGEVFIRLRPRLPVDGLPVPLQVQVIEPELCPHMYAGTAPNGNKIRAGIEFDDIGRRVAYYMYQTRPGDLVDWTTGWDVSQLRRIPAESVKHVYDPLRAGQLRGIPHLTQALIKLNELDKFDDATLLRQQIANLFAAFLTQANTDGDLSPITGLAADDTRNDRPVVALEPGIVQELGPGEKIEFSKPPDPPLTYAAFMKQQLQAAGAASGVPYEILTGDMSGLNDRIMRVLLHEFRRAIQVWQIHIVEHQMCGPIWEAFVDRAYLNGSFNAPAAAYAEDPEPWSAVMWSPHRWPYIHPVQDIEADVAACRAGFTTRSAIVSEQGDDAEMIDAEQAEDNKRADELGLKYESDGRQGAAPSAAPPVPQDDPAADPAITQENA